MLLPSRLEGFEFWIWNNIYKPASQCFDTECHGLIPQPSCGLPLCLHQHNLLIFKRKASSNWMLIHFLKETPLAFTLKARDKGTSFISMCRQSKHHPFPTQPLLMLSRNCMSFCQFETNEKIVGCPEMWSSEPIVYNDLSDCLPVSC